jgi:hypothetical protein
LFRFLALALILVPMIAVLRGAAPARAALAMPEAVASYRIRVRYDPVTHELIGRSSITWLNTSPESVSDLQLHLYLNAFKNLKSSFLQETMTEDDRIGRLLDGAWGWTEITSLRLEGGGEQADRIEFLAPDDGNADDRTVARVVLPRPVAPGERLQFDNEFNARMPRAVDRCGWARDFVMAAQWFPKLGVYEPAGKRGRQKGGWNCHQFHATSEFYADFGDYDVQITVPVEWTIGATGERVERRENGDGTVSERFIQRGVHDFAWTASPRFRVHRRTFRSAQQVRPAELAAVARELGRTPEQLRLPDVAVTLLAFPDEGHAVGRSFDAVFAAIEYFGLWYGPYPYDHVTVVIPPHDASIVGGMEYPTLFLGESSFMTPPAFQTFEETLIHEFGHQYWYGIVASNEFEESWLDEGFVSYSTARVMDEIYGPRIATWPVSDYAIPGVEWHRLSLPWRLAGIAEPPEGWGTLPLPLFGVFGRALPISDTGRRRMRYLARPATDDVVRNAWEFRSSEVYGTNSYSRPATVLATLERLVGRPDWARVLRAYAERHRFGHPTTRDVVASLEAVTKRDWDWFFEQFVWGHRRLDYAVAEITSDEIDEPPGVYGERGRRRVRTASAIERERRERERRRGSDTLPSEYVSEVVVERRGDAVIPIELKVFFADSTVVLEHWDGRYQWARFRYQRPARVDSALLDPEGRWLLDTDRLNNSRARRADRTAARRWSVHWLLWVQSFLQLVGWLA